MTKEEKENKEIAERKKYFSENASYNEEMKDNSMICAGIHKGDTIFFMNVEDNSIIKNGDIVQVCYGDFKSVVYAKDMVIGRYYETDDEITIKFENKKYEPMVFKGAEKKRVLIFGKALGYLSYLK